MARWLYTLLFYLITPLILLRLAYRASKAPAYRQRLAERFGLFSTEGFKQPLKDCIWVHAVSVGETIAAAPMVKKLQQQYPTTPIVVTTMTPTGSERVRALFGDEVFHVYAPYDLPGPIKRFLQRLRPKLLVIMETELWPNTIHYCHKNAIPVVVANARLSAKSAAGYQRFAALIQPMLTKVSTIVAQSQADADRFLSLGLPPTQLIISGSIKFDVEISAELQNHAAQLKQQWSQQDTRLIILASSTHEGEDEIILNAFKQLLAHAPNTLLTLVPRHPERFDKVAGLIQQSGLSCQRRSISDTPSASTQVYLGDTMGELLLLYGCANIAIVGGSFIPSGGHNMLEPAAWGLAIITGESDFNFAAASALLQQQNALIKTTDADSLFAALNTLSHSATQRQTMGTAAVNAVAANRGALARLMAVLNQYLP
ncbi:MAG: lipid IV(A) 3-deoxy-D-manno-octulosonic acid transferase [Spongiibacteraceae bacterium]